MIWACAGDLIDLEGLIMQGICLNDWDLRRRFDHFRGSMMWRA